MKKERGNARSGGSGRATAGRDWNKGGAAEARVRVADGPRGRGLKGAVTRGTARDRVGGADAPAAPSAGAPRRPGPARPGGAAPGRRPVARTGAPAARRPHGGGPRPEHATSLQQFAPSDAKFLSKPLEPAEWGERLREWGTAEGVVLKDEQVTGLLRYASRVLAWSRRMRLVGREDPEWLLREQIAPSLLVVSGLPDEATRYVDIGSGAGLPALVAGIVRRSWSVQCVESVRKKCLFIVDSARDLGLEGLHVFRGRAELFAEESGEAKEFDVASSRGVGRPAEVLPLLAPLLRTGGLARVFVPVSEVDAATQDGVRLGWELVETIASSQAPVVVQSWRKA